MGWGPRAYNWLWGADTGFNTPGRAVPDVPGNEMIDSQEWINKRLDKGGDLALGAATGQLTESKDKEINQRFGDVKRTLSQEFPVFAGGVLLEVGGLFFGPEDVILVGILKAKGLIVKSVTRGGKQVLGIFTKAGKEVVGDELKALRAEYESAGGAARNFNGPNQRALPAPPEMRALPAPKGLPVPEASELSNLGSVADRGGLTRAGRSLTKHASGKRGGSTAFPDPKGNPAQINQQAQMALENILNDPAKVVKQRPGRPGERLLQINRPDGSGVIFKWNGTQWEFSHFAENLF